MSPIKTGLILTVVRMKSKHVKLIIYQILVIIVSGCNQELPWVQKKIIKDLTPQGQPSVSFSHCTLSSANIDTLVFGMHIHGEQHTSPPTLNAIDDIGIPWVLNGFHWPSIEGSRNQYTYIQNYDAFFLAMAERNVNVLMSIGNYWPTWIEDTEQLKIELYELTKLLVRRYKPGGDFSQQHGLQNYGVKY